MKPNYRFTPLRATAFVTTLIAVMASTSVRAHEYWLEPARFEVKVGDKIEADLRNGENFKGNRLYYLENTIERFEITSNSGTFKVKGDNGDQPALSYQTAEAGLHILSYQSTFSTLGFKKWDKFTSYLDNQGLDGIASLHEKRGLPKTGFVESYARTVKALVQVGNTEGRDRATGLPYEFVAVENPYQVPQLSFDTARINIILLLNGQPAPNRQVLVFQDNGTVTMKTLRTNENGAVSVPLVGGGKFMLSSVHMYAGDENPETDRTEWYSYWANLVFAAPGHTNR